MSAAKKNTAYYINVLVIVALIFGFGFLPPIDPITEVGMQILGILLGLLYGWTFVNLLWPSLLGMLAMAIFGIMPISDLLKAGYGNDVTVLIIFILVFSSIVEEAGISKGIAMFLVTRPMFMGRPWIFSFVLLFVAFFLSATTSPLPAIFICWAILYRIASQIGYKPRDKWPALMVLGIILACTIGLSLFPFKSVPLTVLGSFTALSDQTVPFFSYFCFTLPVCLLSIIVYILLCKFIFRPDVSNLSELTVDTFGEEAKVSFTTYQKIIMVFLALMILLLLLPSVLPERWIISQFFASIGSTGTLMLLIAIMCLLKYDDKPIMDFKVMAKGISWDIVILTATVLPLSSYITNDATGIIPFLSKYLSALFEEKSTFIFLVLVIVLAVILTNFCNNAVTGILLITITFSFASANGINPIALAVIITYCVHLAILTPAGSPMAAILHGNREWISAGDIYKYGSIALIAICIIVVLIGQPITQFVF